MTLVRAALCLVTIATALAAPARAESRPIPSAVDVSLDAGVRKTASKDVPWKKACDALAQALKTGSGPWGLGLFRQARCLAKPAGRPSDPKRWLLAVARTESALTLTLTLPGPSPLVASLSLDASPHDARLLADPTFAALAALALVDQLPFLARVDLAALHANGGALPRQKPAPSRLPSPPATLVLYGAALDGATGFVEPRPYGEGRASGDGWRFALDGAGKGDAFVHHADGPGQLGAALRESIEAVRGELLAAVPTARVAPVVKEASYVRPPMKEPYIHLDARYAASMASDLIASGGGLSLDASYERGDRSGPWLAARMWPTVEGELFGEVAKAGGAAAKLGWRFGWSLPGGLGVDVTPAVGVLSYSVSLPFQTAEAKGVTLFDVASQPTVGGSAGLSLGLWRVAARLWGGLDRGIAGGSGNSTAQTTLFGGDLGYDLLQTRHYRVSLLGFGAYELTRLDHRETGKAETLALTYVEIPKPYVGAGVGVSW